MSILQKWPALNVVLRDVHDLKPYINNPRTHPPEQIAQIKASMLKFGVTQPALHDADDNIIAGHGRIIAAQELYNEGHKDFKQYPCCSAVGWDEAQIRAYVIVDNKTYESGGWNDDLLNFEIGALSEMGFDLGDMGFDFDVGDIDLGLDDSAGNPPYDDVKKAGALADKFGAPPFSVLDTRQGYWQDRRNGWLAITGNLTETKEGVLGADTIIATINDGSSNFDPVLAELMFKWFCPQGGKVLDPFGGSRPRALWLAILA